MVGGVRGTNSKAQRAVDWVARALQVRNWMQSTLSGLWSKGGQQWVSSALQPAVQPNRQYKSFLGLCRCTHGEPLGGLFWRANILWCYYISLLFIMQCDDPWHHAQVRTENPWEANLFYVPANMYYYATVSELGLNLLRSYLKLLRATNGGARCKSTCT